ncbi:MAG: SDR family oxidoreductase [Rhizobiaceae bacterium]|nr:SDR family oxidoreductase [Rhizobiaceae bacterium]
MAPRCVFVTGAAQGIGAAIGRAFHAAGDKVALLDRSEAVNDLATTLDPSGATAMPLVGNVDDEAALQGAFTAAVEHFGQVDVMVNNAARTAIGSVWDINVADWDAVMATNLRGTFLGCRIAAGHMRERGLQGRIINLSSLAGQRGGTATGLHYGASKAGILVVTKVFAQELAANGITVNAIAPAAIDGPVMETLAEQTRQGLQRGIPVGRFGRDREVAAAALYLASEDAAFVTGATLDVNGGLFMR